MTRNSLSGLALSGVATSSRWKRIGLAMGLAIFASGQALATQKPAKPGEIKPDVLYHNYCSVCHGDKGDGNSRARGSLVPPPKDFTKITNLPRDYMIIVTADGKPGTAMVGWKTQLNQAEIEAVVDYVRQAFMQVDLSPVLQRGRAVYQQSCVSCHGERGQGVASAGATKPLDFGSVKARTELTRDKMIASLGKAHSAATMKGFPAKLASQDAEAVVDYVRLAFMHITSPEAISGTRAHTGREQPAAKPVPPPASQPAPGPSSKAAEPAHASKALPFPGGLMGDASKGKAFYNDNCATCHGVKGDGQGPRAYFINPKPRNFIEPKSRQTYNRPSIYAAVTWGTRGTEMPAWKFVLTEQQIADVSEYVFSAFINPQSASTAAATK